MVYLKIGIIGGSGLDDPDILKNRQKLNVHTPFGDPSDDLICGEIGGVECILLARHGRKHNIMPGKVNYRANIWALKEAGCTHIIATTATGSLQEHIRPGELVLLDSFIDRTKGREQTFYDGEPGHPIGICHLPFEPAYCEKTREAILEAAKDLNLPIHKTGTVVAVEGPRFSSRVESKMFRLWGGDVINMTALPEVVLAKEAKICYASIAMATDYDCWRDDDEGRVGVVDVLEMFKRNADKVTKLLSASVLKVAAREWDDTIKTLKDTVDNSLMLPK